MSPASFMVFGASTPGEGLAAEGYVLFEEGDGYLVIRVELFCLVEEGDGTLIFLA